MPINLQLQVTQRGDIFEQVMEKNSDVKNDWLTEIPENSGQI